MMMKNKEEVHLCLSKQGMTTPVYNGCVVYVIGRGVNEISFK